MKISTLLGLAGLAALSQGARVKRDYDNNDYYVLHLDDNTEPEHIAARLGLEHEGRLDALEGHYVFRTVKADHDVVKPQIKERRRRKRDLNDIDVLDGVKLVKKQIPRPPHQKRYPPPALHSGHKSLPGLAPNPRAFGHAVPEAVERQEKMMRDLDINDPIFTQQWHLLNVGQPGHDINVTDVWLDGITGQNVTVAIIDDGLDMYSNDLKDNYYAEGSWDFNEHDPEPRPTLDDDKHGTRCAGEVSAARNDVCGVGVAYDSKIAGIRILSGQITDSDEADALVYKFQDNYIYSCSWGPPDDGKHMEAPDVLISRAMLRGVQEGRNGLGSVYVFASGNGALHEDNCNFDGYTNSIYSVTVGAVDREGKHPYYSEHCSAQLVVAYSSGGGDSIHTTDVGEAKCYSGHGGTSAAAPLVVGVYALVLQVRPDLTWRDLQYLTMLTAVKVEDSEEPEWQETAIGRQFSHTFGYGAIDAWSIVELAKDWELVKPQAWYFSPWLHVKQKIPEGDEGIAVDFEVTQDMLTEANLARIEHITVTMNVEHSRRGDISVDLISPENVISHLATARKEDDANTGYENWTFMSVAHWGETGLGRWTLIVRDTKSNKHQGKFIDWHLKLWGESVDPEKATLLPMPEEDDDADHDKIVSTVSLSASTTAAPANPAETHGHEDAPTDISEHPVRPTNAPKPTEFPDNSGQEPGVEGEPSESEADSDSNWVSWLPSFGASKKAQIWIYGAIGTIAVFCAGLGIFLFVARRRRMRNDTSRNNYEFEMLDDDETQGLNSGEKPLVGGRRNRRTRGGELYDAFAEGSDDELHSDFEDYTDREASIESRRGQPEQQRTLAREEEQYVVGGDSDDDDSDESDDSSDDSDDSSSDARGATRR